MNNTGNNTSSLNRTMRELCETERPYEKSIKYGVNTLSDAELIAIILRSGSKHSNALLTAYNILNAHPVHKGIVGLNYLTIDELKSIDGIGEVKAIQMCCLAEIAKRMSRAVHRPFISFNSPQSIADYYMGQTRYLDKECVYILMFDTKQNLIKELKLSEGTVNRALLSTREIFIQALRYEAVYIILVHNHPSGDPTPSNDDIDITYRIYDAGELVGISLMDHIILGNNCYVSLTERGIINEKTTNQK